jgi:hypothetical protein
MSCDEPAFDSRAPHASRLGPGSGDAANGADAHDAALRDYCFGRDLGTAPDRYPAAGRGLPGQEATAILSVIDPWRGRPGLERTSVVLDPSGKTRHCIDDIATVSSGAKHPDR